jgi:hypothetical protein
MLKLLLLTNVNNGMIEIKLYEYGSENLIKSWYIIIQDYPSIFSVFNSVVNFILNNFNQDNTTIEFSTYIIDLKSFLLQAILNHVNVLHISDNVDNVQIDFKYNNNNFNFIVRNNNEQ